MKNKSILIAIVIMVATAIIGSVFLHSIDSISAKERLLSMINTVSPIQSMRIDTEGSIWINFPDELKKLMANSPLQYDKMKINGFTECIYNPQNLQILSQQSTDISGMKMDTSIFINHDEIFIKYPLLGDALYASIDDINKIAPMTFNKDWLPKIYTIIFNSYKEIYTSLINELDDTQIYYGEDMIFEQNGYSQTLKTIYININIEDFFNSSIEFAYKLLNDEGAMALLDEIIATYADDEDTKTHIIKEKENIISILEDLKDGNLNNKKLNEEFKDAMQSINEIFKDSEIQIVLGINNMNVPLFVETQMDMNFNDQITNNTINMTYSIRQTISKMNAIKEIKPNFKTEKTIDIIQFIKSLSM